jgi:hypothetical protein
MDSKALALASGHNRLVDVNEISTVVEEESD